MKSLILLAAILWSTGSFGQNQSQQQLIQQNNRPTVSSILADSQNLEDYYNNNQTSYAGRRLETFRSYFPRLIVSLEKAYPQGVYSFLGRDMALIADALEAYYQFRLHQDDRISFIPFSTPSLNGSTPKLITQFLAQIGLNIDPSDKFPRAFVIVDYTSYAASGRNNGAFPSQARYIFESVVTALKQSGFTGDDIAKRIAVVSLDIPSNSLDILSASSDQIDSLKSENARNLGSPRWVQRLLRIDNCENMAYRSEWTDKFGSIYQKDNQLVTTPESYFSYEHKNMVYRETIQTLNVILSADMDQQVKELAAAKSVVFAKTSAGQKLNPMPDVDHDRLFRARIKDLLSRFQPVANDEFEYRESLIDHTSFDLSENAVPIADLFFRSDSIKADHYYEIATETLMKLYEEQMIGSRDVRRIFPYLLNKKPITSDSYIQMLQARYSGSHPFNFMFGKPSEREKMLESLPETAKQNYLELIDNGQLPISCKYLKFNWD